MKNENGQHAVEQQLKLLKGRIEARSRQEEPILYENLINIFGEGFKRGALTTYNTHERRRVSPNSFMQNGVRYAQPISEEQVHYLNNVFPKISDRKSRQLWEAIKTQKDNVQYLVNLIKRDFLPFDAQDLLDLYFLGLEKGIYFTHVDLQVKNEEYIRQETVRYTQSFEDTMLSDSEFMNGVFLAITARLNETLETRK